MEYWNGKVNKCGRVHREQVDEDEESAGRSFQGYLEVDSTWSLRVGRGWGCFVWWSQAYCAKDRTQSLFVNLLFVRVWISSNACRPIHELTQGS
jgi:hypothetical protein